MERTQHVQKLLKLCRLVLFVFDSFRSLSGFLVACLLT
uniref:Uncharacterized protein n=1 Tax=Anopheles quadriannulatus TaxID=34691 RepID=A0A182XTQ2_ANOQN